MLSKAVAIGLLFVGVGTGPQDTSPVSQLDKRALGGECGGSHVGPCLKIACSRGSLAEASGESLRLGQSRCRPKPEHPSVVACDVRPIRSIRISRDGKFSLGELRKGYYVLELPRKAEKRAFGTLDVGEGGLSSACTQGYRLVAEKEYVQIYSCRCRTKVRLGERVSALKGRGFSRAKRQP